MGMAKNLWAEARTYGQGQEPMGRAKNLRQGTEPMHRALNPRDPICTRAQFRRKEWPATLLPVLGYRLFECPRFASHMHL